MTVKTIACHFTGAASAGYTGPGDIVSSAFAWWGLRAYSAATRGTNCVELRRDSDHTAQPFVTLSDGKLDVGSITTFKGAANLYIRTLYDQSGNGRHLTQTTNSNQPRFNLADLGALPTIGGVGIDDDIMLTAALTLPQPFTASVVAYYDGEAGIYAYAGETGSLAVRIGRRGGTAILDCGSEQSQTISNGWHSVHSVANGASSDICIDGTSNTKNVGTNGFSSIATAFMSDAVGVAYWGQRTTEFGYWPTASWSSGDKSALSSNQHTYWAF